MARGECPAPREECRYPRPFSDLHHTHWPRAEYEEAGTIEARWRNLGKLCEQLCRCVHDEKHATETPPPMPDRDQMVDDLLASKENMSRKVRDALAAAIKARHGKTDAA